MLDAVHTATGSLLYDWLGESTHDDVAGA